MHVNSNDEIPILIIHTSEFLVILCKYIKMNVSIIILAAGESKRMGVPKQLLDIHGEKMLKKVIHEAMETDCFPITVVVGAHKAAIVPELKDMPINITDNPHWKSGMASSIKMGLVGSYLITKEIDAVLFLTADMPSIDAAYINQIIQTGEQNPDKQIVASDYGGKLGIPALFKKTFFEQILDLTGDQGAKNIIAQNLETVGSVPIGGKGQDLDTKIAYFQYLNQPN